MLRIGIIALIGWLLLGSDSVQAQTQKVLDKTFDEWKVILQKDERPNARKAALLVMQVFGADQAGVVEAVSEVLLNKKEDPELRRLAVQVVGKLGPRAKLAITPLLDTMVLDEIPEMREEAVRALSGDMIKALNEGHIPTLAKGLQDKHEGTRIATAEALREVGDLTRDILPQLITVAKDDKMDPLTRKYMVKILAQYPDQSVKTVPAYISIIKESRSDSDLRQLAVEELAGLGKLAAEASPPLQDIFQNKEAKTDLRVAAAIALIQVGGDAKKIWPLAQTSFEDPANAVRYQAVRLAGVFGKGEKDLVPELLKRAAVKEFDLEIRLAALQELGKLGSAVNDDGRKALHELADNDVRQDIRKAAAAALKRIEGGS
jgi:hypothetical protein